MTLIRLQNDSTEELSQQIRSIAGRHWHDLFRENFARDKERYEAMCAIVNEHDGTSNFDPRTITLFQSLISQRYFENTPVFLNSDEVKNLWKQSERTTDGLAFEIGKYRLFFPRLQTSSGNPVNIPAFGFINIPASAEYQGPLDSALLKNVKQIVKPAVLLKPDLIAALDRHGLMKRFTERLSVVIEHSNHDFVHGLTNPTRDENIPEAHDYKTKTFLSNFMNPDMAKNGFVVEECAVIEMNRLIFERLRDQNSASIGTFVAAVNDVAAVVAELEKNSENAAAKQARSILKNFLSFLFDKGLLDNTPVNEWGELIKTAETRKDISICKYTTPVDFRLRGVMLGEQRPASEPAKKPQGTPDENDAYCAQLLETGALSRIHPALVYQDLGASVAQDLSGWMIPPAERTKISKAAHHDDVQPTIKSGNGQRGEEPPEGHPKGSHARSITTCRTGFYPELQ